MRTGSSGLFDHTVIMKAKNGNLASTSPAEELKSQTFLYVLSLIPKRNRSTQHQSLWNDSRYSRFEERVTVLGTQPVAEERDQAMFEMA